jgi:hypothetical protein
VQYFDFFGKRWLKFTETTWYEADDSHELFFGSLLCFLKNATKVTLKGYCSAFYRILIAIKNRIANQGGFLLKFPLSEQVPHEFTRRGIQRSIATILINEFPKFVG